VPRYLDTDAAAQFLRELGVKASPSTLKRMRARCVGGGPAFYRSGRHGPVRYSKEDLIAWVELRRVDPPTTRSGADGR
jgi:hypothetical protein